MKQLAAITALMALPHVAPAQVAYVTGAETANLFLAHCAAPMLESGTPDTAALILVDERGKTALRSRTYSLGSEGARLAVVIVDGRTTCSLRAGWSRPDHPALSGYTQFRDADEFAAYATVIERWGAEFTEADTLCPKFENLNGSDMFSRRMLVAGADDDFTYALFEIFALDDRQRYSAKAVVRAGRTLKETCRSANPPGAK